MQVNGTVTENYNKTFNIYLVDAFSHICVHANTQKKAAKTVLKCRFVPR